MVLEIEWGYMGLPYCFSLGSTIPSGLHGLTWGSTSIGGSTKLTQCTPEFLKTTSDSGASLILWLDFMKYGVVSSTELNNTIEFVSRALGTLLVSPAAFASHLRCPVNGAVGWERNGGWDEWPPFSKRMFKSLLFLLCINQKVLDASIYYTIFNLQMKKVPVKNTNI